MFLCGRLNKKKQKKEKKRKCFKLFRFFLFSTQIEFYPACFAAVGARDFSQSIKLSFWVKGKKNQQWKPQHHTKLVWVEPTNCPAVCIRNIKLRATLNMFPWFETLLFIVIMVQWSRGRNQFHVSLQAVVERRSVQVFWLAICSTSVLVVRWV